MAEIEFISAEVCPFAQRTHLVLREKGLDYEHREVDLSNKPAWFEDVSPYSKVPVLKHGDVVVYESAIINEYIEETWPEPAFLPADPRGRALARIWIDFDNTRFVPAFYKVLLAREPERRSEIAEALIRHLVFMEDEGLAKLGADPYWLGTEVSLVDFAYYPHFERMCVLSHYRGIEIPERCERLKKWHAAMCERASVQATAHSEDYYIESYVKYADNTADGVTAHEMRSA